jgi:hypothetical protein
MAVLSVYSFLFGMLAQLANEGDTVDDAIGTAYAWLSLLDNRCGLGH